MRPKIVLSVIGLGLFGLIALSLLRGKHDASTGGTATAKSAIEQSTTAGQAPISMAAKEAAAAAKSATAAPGIAADPTGPSQPANVNASNAKPATVSSSSAEGQTHEEYVEQRVGELMDLGMSDDPESLKTILSEVNNADADIRKAAVEAVKQFGSTNAIPKLEEMLSSTDPTVDKQDIQEAIAFLKLPSALAKHN